MSGERKVGSFDTINPFQLEENRFLFFDIFCKNNEVVMVCPVYSETYTDFDAILLKQDGQPLSQLRIIKKIEYEPALIAIYELNEPAPIVEIEVCYQNVTRSFQLVNQQTQKTMMLVQTTLMKDDFELINIFHDYYKKQGVDHFYIYYNGQLTEEIKRSHFKPDITLVEWDFHYWNHDCEFAHHAQTGQLHHALYKYGKDVSEYMIFNDYDEYMYIKGKKLIELVSDKKFDTYGFINYWCNTMDNKIPETFPLKFLTGSKFPYGERSKCIHKTGSIAAIGIHFGVFYESEAYDTLSEDSQMLLHFYNWSNPVREEITNFETEIEL